MEQFILDNIAETVLDNGLKVICLKKPSAPVVSVQVWYRTGSSRETIGQRGISHILEHMMFRGSSHVAPEQHSRNINDTGGHCNAFTAEDVCAYLNSVPAGCLDMVLDLEADRMAGLLLRKDILETERKVIIEEYHTYMNNPVAKAFFEFRRSFYGEHPYAIGPLGLIEDIQQISSEDCQSYFQKNYVPSNAVISIVGDIKDEQEVFEMVRKRFGALKSESHAAETFSEAVIPAVGKPGFMKRSVEFDVPMLIMGFPGPQSSNADALSLDMLQMIVSQGESSRLHREVVRRQSLGVMAGGMNHFLRLSGMSLFFAAFTPDCPVRKVMDAMKREIERVRSEGVTEEEIEKCRNTILTKRTFDMYSSEHICQRLGYSDTVDGDYRIWIKRINAVLEMNLDTLNSAVSRYWDPETLLTLYLKPKKIKPMLYFVGLARKLFVRK
jgi:zinc protease